MLVLCQLMLVPFQLMLRLCYLMLDPCQPTRHGERQPGRSLCQLVLSLPQFLLSLRQRIRIPDDKGLACGDGSLGKRKLEMLDRGSVRDLREARRLVFGRPLEEDVGGCDQRDAGQEEEAAVQGREPEPGGASRQSQPGAWREPGVRDAHHRSPMR
ncbi:MAG TPA: hypothetical protein VMF09_03930 [Solirubrobacteraceae bacterium]|nr:hypothetical protein [Solirubrobacteraceae bacterium]